MPEHRRIIHKKRAHDDPLIRKLLDGDLTPEERDSVDIVKRAKSSPLIDEIANRTRMPGAPGTQPLTATGARGVGQQDVSPTSSVNSRNHTHDHVHDGLASDPFEAARFGRYVHSHPHEHAVDGSVEAHDNAAHFALHQAMTEKVATLRKMAASHPDAQIRRGAQEVLKGSIEPGQAADAVPGAPAAARGVTSPSGASAGYCPNRSCSCGGCGPSCAGDCCFACTMGAELDRRQTMHFGAVAELVKEAQFWQDQVENGPNFYSRQYAAERVKATAAELRKAAGLDDDKTLIRKLAAGERSRPASETAIVHKAASASSSLAMTPELTKMIRAAVNKAFENLGTRIDALNERAPRRS